MQADSLIKTLQIRDVKEAIYISQLDHLSDWLIAFVTLLFGVSIISQLLTFEARTKRISDQYEEQKTENENHIKEVEEKFKLSEKDNIVAFISIFEFQGAYYRDKNELLKALDNHTEGLKRTFDLRKLYPDDIASTNHFIEFFIAEYSLTLWTMVEDLTTKSEYGSIFHPGMAEQNKKYFRDIYSNVPEDARFRINTIISKIDEGTSKYYELATEHFKVEPKKGKVSKLRKKT